MLDVSPSNLLLEVQTSIEYVKGYLAAYEHHRRVMAGPVFNIHAFLEEDDEGGFWGSRYDPENVVHEFLAHVGPRMSFQNPYFKAGTRRPGTQQAVALGIHHALNRVVRDIRMYETNRVLLADFAMAWFWAMVHPTERTDWMWRDPSDPVMTPALERISPRHGFWDPQALERKKIRLIGHIWEKDKEDLLEAAEQDPETWNAEAIDGLQPGSGQDYLGRDDKNMVERNTVTGASIWLPDVEDDDHPGPDEGFHGSIVEIALGADSGDEGRFLRPLRPYYGPRWGPYVVCGARVVPDETAFLSPITAAAAQIRDLNDIARRGVRNARGYRRIMVVNDAHEDLSERIENEPDRSVFPAAGVKREDIQEFEINGNTQQEIAQEIRQRSRVDRALAQDDAQRGSVNEQGTATAVAEAASNSNAQADDMAQTFAHGIEQIGVAFAFYLYHDDRIILPLGEDAARELGMQEPFYFGGDDRDPEVRRRHMKRLRRMGQIPPKEWMLWGGDEDRRFGATFDDLEIELELGSMKHIDPRIRSQQVRNCFDATLAVGQIVAQAPWIDAKGLLQMIGEDNDVQGLEDFFDEQLFQQMMKGALAQHGPRQVPMLARFAGAGGGQRSAVGAGQGSQPQGGLQRPFGGGRGGAPAQPGGGASARASKAGSTKSTP